jgi:hypothetical protein
VGAGGVASPGRVSIVTPRLFPPPDPLCPTCHGYGVLPLYDRDGTIDDTETCPDECHQARRIQLLRAGLAYPTHHTEHDGRI